MNASGLSMDFYVDDEEYHHSLIYIYISLSILYLFPISFIYIYMNIYF